MRWFGSALLLGSLALCGTACDPVYSLDVRVIATARAQELATTPSQVLLREEGSIGHDGGVYDTRLIVVCDATGDDLTAVREYGGVCGGKMSFTAYLVPVSTGEADTLPCGVFDAPIGVEMPEEIPPDALAASGTAYPDVGPKDCAEGDVTLTLRLEPPAP